jgi:hypothetical protein
MPTSVKLAEGDDRKVVVICGECGKESSAEALPKPKVVGLSEIPRDKDGLLNFGALEKSESPIAPEVFRAQAACSEVAAAMQKGIITPAQRPHFEKLALTDIEGFRAIVKTMKPQLDLSEHGFAGGGGEGDSSEIGKVDARLRELVDAKLKASPKLTRGQALKMALSENPDLAKRRAALMRE